jgi:hypothetical protein
VIWLPRFCHTITYAGNSSSKLRYVKKFFSWFNWPSLMVITKCWSIPVKVCGYNSKLNVILKELTVLWFYFLHILFGRCNFVGVPKYYFQVFNKCWLICQYYCSVLPDMWQDVAQDCTPLTELCIPHHQLFISTADGPVPYYYSWLTNSASQSSPIWAGKSDDSRNFWPLCSKAWGAAGATLAAKLEA